MSNEEKLREFGAVTVLQRTLEKYAKQKNITIEEALKKFVSTPMYEALFDYEGTGLWKEGPDYLICFMEELADNQQPTTNNAAPEAQRGNVIN